ncbi:MAG: SGNH/GDSL hydrolase family protein [Candidatus Zixiibacteriota bacterium]|nr:MAG: SGNH/GDSL hydrolase family protein [candidate division Zixibacteria bacterium]
MKKLYPVLFTVAFFVVLELLLTGISLISPWDRMVNRLGVTRTTFLGSHQFEMPEDFLRDPDLFWYRKPNHGRDGFYFNNLGFRGNDLQIERAADGRRMVCLGNSCTLGSWVPDSNNVYTFILEKELAARYGSQDIEVINAAIEGYTSLQMLQMWRKKARLLHPDVVTVYAGINDIVYAPNKEDKDVILPAAACKVSNLLLSFRVGRLLNAGVKRSVSFVAGSAYVTPFDESKGFYRRVSQDDYRTNLVQLVHEVRDSGAKIIFITAPIRERFPFVFTPTPQMDADGKTVQWCWEDGIGPDWIANFGRREDPHREQQHNLMQIQEHPSWPVPYFKVGYYHERQGDSVRAAEYYSLADSLDQQRHALSAYNQTMREVAAGFHVPLVDCERTFSDRKSHKLFAADGYHPNEAGHKAIAEDLFRLVDSLWAHENEMDSMAWK